MITIENYEEYFLLYVDNELPAELRTAIERFVADHPQTGEELDAMLQCRMQPDHESFPDKTALLRYDEELICYIDGELDARKRSEVEALVQKDPAAAEALGRLRQTVSHPDPTIVFPDKESLYRYEKNRRVILLPWLRAGIAAAVLAAAALLLLPRGRKEPAQPVVAVKKDPAAVTPASPRTLYPDKKEEQQIEKEKAVYATTKGKGNKPAVKRGEDGTTGTASNPPAIAQARTTADTGSRSAMRPAGVTGSTDVARATGAPDKSGSTGMTIAPMKTGKSSTLPANTVAMVDIPKDQSSFATEELLRQAREEAGADQVDLTSETGGKNKFRGIFRRVTRAFGKTAERDNEGQREVLISAFQVALK
jgi:hypothetical protein